jgi:hypothetical protein
MAVARGRCCTLPLYCACPIGKDTRVLSRGGAADHAVPLTGSGCREYSYGGFGRGHPHFHPHATPAGNPRIKRQAHPCRESSKIVRSFGRAWVFAVAAVRRDPVPSDGVAASVPVVASQVATNRQ